MPVAKETHVFKITRDHEFEKDQGGGGYVDEVGGRKGKGRDEVITL